MRTLLMLMGLIILAGCARTPPVTVNYHLARSSIQARVVRTVACDATNVPIIANTVTTTVFHSADSSQVRSTELWRADSSLANSEFKTDFYGDGRLKSINATTVGQGETIFKTAIKIAEMAMEEAPPPALAAVQAACKEFKKAFADKVLTLVFEVRNDFGELDTAITVPAELSSQLQYKQYRLLLGDTCLRIGARSVASAPVSYSADSTVTVKARQPALINASVTTGPMSNCGASTLWSGLVQVSQHGTEYALPIPRAALFGKQVFAAAFDEAGALTQLQYNKDTGAGQLLSVGQAVGEALNITAAEEAATLKAEADVIAAQQRLVKCQVSPSTC